MNSSNFGLILVVLSGFLGTAQADICGRTKDLQPAIMTALQEQGVVTTQDCKVVNKEHLNRLVSLSVKRLSDLKVGDLEGLSNLKALDLDGSDFKVLKNGVLSPLVSLKGLAIWDGQLEKIQDDAFKGLENLEYMDFQENYGLKVSPNAFKNLKALKYLNLGGSVYETDFSKTYRLLSLFDGNEGTFCLELDEREYVLQANRVTNQIEQPACMPTEFEGL